MSAAPHILRVPAAGLVDFGARLFQALGLDTASSTKVAEALVDADLEGIASHGVMLLPMYADKIRAGSVSLAREATVANDTGAAVVLDAGNALGQLTAHQAVEIASERAKKHGLAAVAVRNAFHFGTAGRWASMLAERGAIGVVMSNTRPLMPAPGGAERVVGNNPLAIAMPSGSGAPIVLDMAMSATAMGKIRLADAAGKPIPEGWASDASGNPTTDAAAAIKGMLLPAAGPKGFGLAFMIDLFCGGLASGAIGEAVKPLYGDPKMPYGCAHFFLAIDVAHFRALGDFAAAADGFADKLRGSKRALGVERLYAPGEPAQALKASNAGTCPLAPETARDLAALASSLGVDSKNIFNIS